MTPEILKAIKKFEALQSKYSDYGATDKDSDYVFQLLISSALSKKILEIGTPIEWELSNPKEDISMVQEELTLEAWNVYATILTFSQRADLEELRRYCWRVY